MAPEHEEPRIGWYNRFARHPYYGKTGVNSGVMLMNMTRMRRKYFKVTRCAAAWLIAASLSPGTFVFPKSKTKVGAGETLSE